MMSRGTLSPDVIGDIYEAAVDDERWPSIAQIVASATGTPSAGVWFVEQGQVQDLSLTADGVASHAPYIAHYAKQDLWAKGFMIGPPERVRLGYELFDERELVKTEFYNDFARPTGVFRPMGVVMRLARGTVATVSTHVPPGNRLLDDRDKPRLERLVPHLRRALQLRLNQRKHAPRAHVHAAVLDALAFGVVVCDAGGGIVLANKAAETLARTGAGITFGDRRKGLGALMPAETRALAALTHDAANGGAGGVVRLTDRSGCLGLVALITPLPRNFGLGDSGRSGLALVTLRSAWDSPSFSSELLIALFGLSPAQAEIALAIFDGCSPEEIAAHRGVAVSTLRTHLAQIFVRTGAENQRDLVRLLGMLPPARSQLRAK